MDQVPSLLKGITVVENSIQILISEIWQPRQRYY